MSTSTLPTSEHLERAKRLGMDAGTSAASWATDGNTTEQTYRSLLSGIEQGDPMTLDGLVSPDLSGEYADGPTPTSLGREILGDDVFDAMGEDTGETVDALATAWEEGVSETFLSTIESDCHSALGLDDDTSEDPCTDHGYDTCPDCGNAGTKIGADGYEPCTRFLTCWSDPSADADMEA